MLMKVTSKDRNKKILLMLYLKTETMSKNHSSKRVGGKKKRKIPEELKLQDELMFKTLKISGKGLLFMLRFP